MASGLLSSSWQSENFYETTLSADCTDVDTDIFLTGVPTNSEGTLVIDPDSATSREIIYYSSKTGTKVVCPANGRGYDGSTASSHTSGTKVIMAPIADWFNSLKTLFTTTPQGWSDLADTPDTVTNNGNRSYDLVFNTNDLTDTVSQGMRLRLTRTVSAPTQCADLESGSSQYFSATSASLAGMTFTDDFTVSAWIKLESYAQNPIISRYDGTSGFIFYMSSAGQLIIRGDAGATEREFTSYQSIPLNKWVHVAASLDMSANSGLFYIDGVLVPGSGTGVATALVQAGNLNIGAYNASNYFDGKIAQVAVFSSVLSASTIRSYMSQGLAGTESTLVSAYSFNNTILDLNTTNNNDLTANGSAVATSVDSPFGNYLGGTLDYAIITKTAFSTNTTLTVQVPEGCAIPTSGGVSAVAYSTQAVPYLFPRDGGQWKVGVLQRVNSSASSVTTGVASNINSFYLSIPVGSWAVKAQGGGQGNTNAANGIEGRAGISTTTNTFSETGIHFAGSSASTTYVLGGFSTETTAKLSSATTYYLNLMVNGTGTLTASIRGDVGGAELYAIPAYL